MLSSVFLNPSCPAKADLVCRAAVCSTEDIAQRLHNSTSGDSKLHVAGCLGVPLGAPFSGVQKVLHARRSSLSRPLNNRLCHSKLEE